MFRRWLLLLLYALQLLIFFLFPSKKHSNFGRRKTDILKKVFFQSKPAWVIHEIIHLKALMPEMGCRKIADIFNRIFAESRNMSVGKTFVNEVIKKYNYEIMLLRRKIKNRRPKEVPQNLIWGMDLTGKNDVHGNINNILGIIEHKSRLNLCLTALKDKSSIMLLRYLLNAIELYGKPKFLRTDNESVFTSRLFRFGLFILGIKHQRINLCCPWQNGRIERFFGTLKDRLDKWQVEGSNQLNDALVQFRFWYNHVRPHQHLDGRTPIEAWNGEDIFSEGYKEKYWFESWDGLLTGFYLKI